VARDHAGHSGLRVFTTIDDLLLWDRNFYDNRLGRGGPGLITTLTTSGALNSGESLDYAFGLRVRKYKGLDLVAHSGGWAGFRADMIRFPKENFTVICLVNLPRIDPSTLCRKIADIYLADKIKEEKVAEKAVIPKSPVTLTRDELKNKVGKYANEEGNFIADITLKDNTLFVETRRESFSLIPISKSAFVSKNAPLEITFEFVPAEGEAERANLIIRDEETPLRKIPASPPLTQEQLNAYAGSYYNDELPATYVLVIDKEQLFFRHRNAPRGFLRLIDKDIFMSGYGKMRFQRDEYERITGFYLDAGRVRIQFMKR